MMKPLECYQLTPEELTALRPPERCPFCAARPYWQGVILNYRRRKHFYHPGTISGGPCILSGMGFNEDELERWNTRVTE